MTRFTVLSAALLDLALVAGAVGVVWGIADISVPAAKIAGGLIVIACTVQLARRR